MFDSIFLKLANLDFAHIFVYVWFIQILQFTNNKVKFDLNFWNLIISSGSFSKDEFCPVHFLWNKDMFHQMIASDSEYGLKVFQNFFKRFLRVNHFTLFSDSDEIISHNQSIKKHQEKICDLWYEDN